MKLLILICALCSFFVGVKAQDTKPVEPSKGITFESLLKVKPKKTEDGNSQFTLGGECGNPAEESQLYDQRKGKITKILSANEILFEQYSVSGNEKKDKFTVKLVGIDANQNKIIVKQKLQNILLNQQVEVYGNLRNKSDKKLGGIIWLFGENEDIDEVNIYLLENGIAKYETFESANLVSMVIPCRLQKAEERAKTAKLGIWAK